MNELLKARIELAKRHVDFNLKCLQALSRIEDIDDIAETLKDVVSVTCKPLNDLDSTLKEEIDKQ